MPELPDLLYIKNYLQREVVERTITGVVVRQPIVIRNAIDLTIDRALAGRTIDAVTVHGPFLNLAVSGSLDLVLNLMLAGKVQHQKGSERGEGFLCFSLLLSDGTRLNLCDKKKMAKAYLVRHGGYSVIPRYDRQGIDVLSPEFTREKIGALAAAHAGKQVRVFINDHTLLSAIGNAYADEILFEARLHPKTFVRSLSPGEIDALYSSVRSVLQRAIDHVAHMQEPIQNKVRDHMQVRNRKGEPCTRCGTIIRREGVRGHDVFFCPKCQPALRKLFIDWTARIGK